MPLPPFGLAILATLAILTLAGPAGAESGDEPRGRYDRYGPGRLPPPEMRYRDPRYVPLPRRARLYAPRPTSLIQAYLPRHTELPMYNEPPSRFLRR